MWCISFEKLVCSSFGVLSLYKSKVQCHVLFIGHNTTRPKNFQDDSCLTENSFLYTLPNLNANLLLPKLFCLR